MVFLLHGLIVVFLNDEALFAKNFVPPPLSFGRSNPSQKEAFLLFLFRSISD